MDGSAAGGPGPLGSLRLATPEDADNVDALIQASIRGIFPVFYDERQTAASVAAFHLDRRMIEDGTFLVVGEAHELIACGGWNRRDRSTGRLLDPRTEPALIRFMFVRPDRTRRGLGTRILAACEDAARAEGFGMLALTASLPGLPLYERHGFIVIEETTVALPGGVTLDTAEMEKPIYR